MTVTVRRATHEDLAIIVEFNLAMAAESEDKGLVPEVLTAGVEHLFDPTTPALIDHDAERTPRVLR